MNKKGQGMSTNTIILLILGIMVLVVLILGFTMGWDRISPWISTTNVDNIVTTCSAACTTAQVYDFCSVPRELKDAEGNKITTTCAVFATVDDFAKYSIDSCNINCQVPCDQIRINEVEGDATLSLGKYDVSVLANEDNCFINQILLIG